MIGARVENGEVWKIFCTIYSLSTIFHDNNRSDRVPYKSPLKTFGVCWHQIIYSVLDLHPAVFINVINC